MCVGPDPLSSTGADLYLRCLDQTPPPRELKVSDPKVRDLSLLQLQLVPTAVLHVKFLDISFNRGLLLNNPSHCSTLLLDNNVQAPLVPSVLAAAIDLPLPPGTDEFDIKSQSGGGRTLGQSSSGSSIPAQKRKPNTLGTNTAEAQKKLGKFFKGLGPSKAPSRPKVPRLILFISTRDIRFVLSLAYLTLVGYVKILVHDSDATTI